MALKQAVFFFACLAAAVGCASSGNSSGLTTPYAPGDATVIGDPSGDFCANDACSTAARQCGPDGAADVVVTANGDVADVVCYGQDVLVTDVPVAPVPSYTSDGNNAVLVLDSQADGPDVTGDVTLTGNNAIIYGGGPGVSEIGGTLHIEKNNAKIRGVRIDGDVVIDKNNTKLVLCVIEGNLTISGNNTTVAGCDVFGTVTVSGQNTVLVGDRFRGTDTVSGHNLTCNADTRFDDANANGIVDAGEVGGAITCG